MQTYYKPGGNLFPIYCTNCSNSGHTSKHCTDPITSYGVIIFRCTWNQPALLQSPTFLTGIESVEPSLQYLMIQRKDSIAFIEIIRGKYKLNEYDYIRRHIASMTAEERVKLTTLSFDALWESLWGPTKEGFNSYRHEKEQGRQKLEALRTGTPSLQTLIEESGVAEQTPEWGFPKGRKNNNESEYACAMRETWEETNIRESNIIPIRNMDPIAERFVGSNGIPYCHKYFLAFAPTGVGEQSVEEAAKTNEYIQREVGDIRWCSLEEALSRIRPEHKEKQDVLLRVHSILHRYCPLYLGPYPRGK